MIDDANKLGPMIWITGFSGAGKTTVAHLLRDRFIANDQRPVLFDGDVMRSILGRENSHSTENRLELAQIYARLSREIASQGHPVICATISMFHDVRAWNRANTPRYYEVYLRVPLDQRVARDSKGLYAAEDKATAMVGLDGQAEEPIKPDLTIENWGTVAPDQCADKIWRLLLASEGQNSG